MPGAGPCCDPWGGGGGGGCGAVVLVDVVYRSRRGPRSCSYSGLSVSTGLSDLRGDGVLPCLVLALVVILEVVEEGVVELWC